MKFDIQSFESIGANCEFGFYLRNKGNNLATLFKWVEVLQMRELSNLITNRFVDILKLENIRPYHRTMVLDRLHMMAWHTPAHSELLNPELPASRENLKFSANEEEINQIWEEQAEKIAHLVDRMLSGLASGRVIYVFKPREDNPGNYPRLGLRRVQALTVARMVPKTVAPEVSRAVSTTVRTAASPSAAHIAR